ncbi:hypothetical protein D884_01650 [Pseudomonas sp. URMO17WK12:I10]|nr:hypothetical protein F633_00935 [Pseudomonas sp. LAMO17WK12:I3]RED11742.1 hypothetical protein D884_01650 [Pseudomonas sp. URMO17WK12:I10]SOD10203.1 hypothetical protein SAMN05660967_03418 [Pseudomonas sp. URMO17WK12:I9]
MWSENNCTLIAKICKAGFCCEPFNNRSCR